MIHRSLTARLPFAVSRFLLAGCVCLLTLGGCKRPGSTSQAQPTAPPVARKVAARPKLDPCTLLTKEEIAVVQGSTITDTKGSDGQGGVFRNAQCYFAAAETNKSVSLALTQINPD